MSGGLASFLSSLLTTPFDVVKTRLATGVVPAGTPVFQAMKGIVATEGVKGLFKGVQARVLMSALFGSVGFATFELCKSRLGVTSPVSVSPVSVIVPAPVAALVVVKGETVSASDKNI